MISTSRPPQLAAAEREIRQRRVRAAAPARPGRRHLLHPQLGALERRSLAPPARTRTRAPRAPPGAGGRPSARPRATRRPARVADAPRPPRPRLSTARASADPRQRIAGQQVHHPPAAEGRVHEHHPGRLGLHLADLAPPPRSPAPSAARRARRRPPRARRRPRACPRSPRTSGRCRAARPPRPRPGCTGTAASLTSIATFEARASSFSADATPPRVASRMQRSDGPASSSSASTAGHSERVSDSISASSSNSSRASMIAVPCSPIEPDTMIRSPGRSAAVAIEARGSTTPTPRRAGVHPVRMAALHDLGVAGHDRDSGRAPPRRRPPRPRRAARRPQGPPPAPATGSAPAAVRRTPPGR